MKKLVMVCAAGLVSVLAAATVYAELGTGVSCQPKTSTDASRVRYTANRIMNTSTTASAVVSCNIGFSESPRAVVVDNNGTGGQNISCTGFYYVFGILSNAGVRTSSGTGITFFDWAAVGIQEAWSISCTLPPATGAAETQMSSIEMLQ